jgi:hypothetical protein
MLDGWTILIQLYGGGWDGLTAPDCGQKEGGLSDIPAGLSALDDLPTLDLISSLLTTSQEDYL